MELQKASEKILEEGKTPKPSLEQPKTPEIQQTDSRTYLGDYNPSRLREAFTPIRTRVLNEEGIDVGPILQEMVVMYESNLYTNEELVESVNGLKENNPMKYARFEGAYKVASELGHGHKSMNQAINFMSELIENTENYTNQSQTSIPYN